MKYLKLLPIFFLILLLNSCGYKNINLDSLNNFKINKLKINGEKKLAYKLKNNVELYSSQDSKSIYDIKIDLTSTKITKIKNTEGKITRYSTKLQADILITDTDTKKSYVKTFSSTNDYDVGSIHSDTLNNEKKAFENNIDYISSEIIKYIKLLKV